MAGRRVCFVTGTRAEFGLMQSTLRALRGHPSLDLQIISTGMHLSRELGYSIDLIRSQGWTVDAVVPWKDSKSKTSKSNNASQLQGAIASGIAMAGLAREFDRLATDIVLVVGDRVEPFAAAAAGHLSGRVVAHIHGGDRAMGQVDDSLRHAITKLSHLHFPATQQSAARLFQLGEDEWRIHRVGTPGIDGIKQAASDRRDLAKAFPDLKPRRFALVILHPTGVNDAQEFQRARLVIEAVRSTGFDQTVVVFPNNDPGSGGIIRCWNTPGQSEKFHVNIERGQFLGLMRDAAVLAGNSSSGIIEAASFGTPVVDIGPRQKGRERGPNVVSVEFSTEKIRRELRRTWNDGNPVRYPPVNVYGGNGTGVKIARILAKTTVDDRLMRKLIRY